MNIALFAYSRQGCRTARKIRDCFTEDVLQTYTMERFCEPDFLPFPQERREFYGNCFQWADAMIFVGSCGIAVREIAPHVKDKRTDPAVLCVDELGQFVISLLSGHIGGANEMTARLARHLGATPVITTATDINQKFAVDAWAARNGLCIDSMKLAKAVSAAILEGPVPLASDFPVGTPYPNGIRPGTCGELGISISYRTNEPFSMTLRLIPKVLHVGIGCRKGIGAEAVAHGVEQVLQQHGLDRRAIKAVASIDLKAEEEGLLQFCRAHDWNPVFYSAEQLRQVPGVFTQSAFVQRVTGVDNVCERAALMGAAELIVKKTAIDGVTVAIAAEKWEVRFE